MNLSDSLDSVVTGQSCTSRPSCDLCDLLQLRPLTLDANERLVFVNCKPEDVDYSNHDSATGHTDRNLLSFGTFPPGGMLCNISRRYSRILSPWRCSQGDGTLHDQSFGNSGSFPSVAVQNHDALQLYSLQPVKLKR
jgi:hypothetical protein